LIGTHLTISGENHYPRQACVVYRAHRMRDNQQLLRGARVDSLIARGAGRSYGDCALNKDQGVVLQERLDRFLALDPESGRLTCESGVSLRQIIDTFLPRGFFPRITPGTDQATVGGCIAADVHGKNHHREGSFANCVHWFELLCGNGQVLRCSRDQHADLFFATLGGLGLTGVILRACIELRRVSSSRIRVAYEQAPNLEAIIEKLTTADQATYSVAWMDCLAQGDALGRGVVMTGEHAGVEELPAPLRTHPLGVKPKRVVHVPCYAPAWLLNRTTVGGFNRWYYRRHRDGRAIEDHRTFFYPLEAVGGWNRLYGRCGFVQHQSLIPAAAGTEPIADILRRVAASGRASFLAVLKRMGPGSGGPLSFPDEGLTLALDLARPDDTLFKLTAELDRITADAGGRVYLAKDALLSPELVGRMYPRVGEFRRLRAAHDPMRRFGSSLARRLKLGGEP